MVNTLKEKVINGYQISKQDAIQLLSCDINSLCSCSDQIRKKMCGNAFDICSIINGKSGRCSEDCKYCAQSVHYPAQVNAYSLMETQPIYQEALQNQQKGVLRFSVVTSGKRLDKQEIDKICQTYQYLKQNTQISLCASHGLLDYQDFVKLKNAGVTRYHNNLESSRRFFKAICSTHTYDEKIEAIKAAQKAGLTVCSGGIIGLGETWEDRIDMAFTLKELNINSVPVNVLNPIKGTPMENNVPITQDDVRRTVAIFRFILPNAAIRLAGGRNLLQDNGKQVFLSGANAAITGDMLTTCGNGINKDIKMIRELGYEPKRKD